MTSTTIANLALARLGNSTITDITEDTEIARACQLLYEPTRKELLRSHRWNFAQKRATLTQLADAPLFGWDHAYQLPSDYMRVCEVNESEHGDVVLMLSSRDCAIVGCFLCRIGSRRRRLLAGFLLIHEGLLLGRHDGHVSPFVDREGRVQPEMWPCVPNGDKIFWYSGNSPEFYGQELIDQYIRYVDKYLHQLFPKTQDAKTADAILELFRKAYISSIFILSNHRLDYGVILIPMGFLDFLNPTRFLDYADSFVPGFEERSSGIVPPPRSATSGVTTNDALSLASVYRSVSIIATAMKQLGIHVYRDDAEVTPTPLVIRQPDIKVTREVWMEQTINSMALSGNAYWLIGRNGRGETVNLEVLNPFDVMIQTDDYGNALYYTYRGTIRYELNDLQHLSMMRVPGNVYGLGPIQAAQKELLNARDTRDYASVWFTDSGIPNGVLKSDQMLSPDQASAAKDAWNLTAGAKNGVAVLGNGLNYQPMYLNPRDSMFIESQAWNVQQVARLFGVPANMLLASVDGNSMTYTNMVSRLL